MTRRQSTQLGLFGGEGEPTSTHLVSAHTRIQADGSEVFVREHLRWSPVGPRAPRRTVRVALRGPADHPSLFEGLRPER